MVILRYKIYEGLLELAQTNYLMFKHSNKMRYFGSLILNEQDAVKTVFESLIKVSEASKLWLNNLGWNTLVVDEIVHFNLTDTA